LDFDIMATKFKMASETYSFLILLSKLQFPTDFKKLECIRSVFLLYNFYRKTLFRKSKMADFSKMTSFLRKNHFFSKRVVPTLNSTFFKSEKGNSVVQTSKIYQQICQRKFSKMVDVFKMAFELFSCMK
jgi:hypothetical protein